MRRRRLFTAEVEPAEGAEIAGSSRGKGDGEIAASLEAAEEVETIERSRGEYGEIATRARSGVSSPPPTHNEYLLEMRDLGMTTDSPRSTSSAATAHSRPRPGRISAGRAAKLDSLAAPRWKVMTDLSTEPSACDSRSRISAASTGSRVGESTRLVQRQPLSRRANPSAHSILFTLDFALVLTLTHIQLPSSSPSDSFTLPLTLTFILTLTDLPRSPRPTTAPLEPRAPTVQAGFGGREPRFTPRMKADAMDAQPPVERPSLVQEARLAQARALALHLALRGGWRGGVRLPQRTLRMAISASIPAAPAPQTSGANGQSSRPLAHVHESTAPTMARSTPAATMTLASATSAAPASSGAAAPATVPIPAGSLVGRFPCTAPDSVPGRGGAEGAIDHQGGGLGAVWVAESWWARAGGHPFIGKRAELPAANGQRGADVHMVPGADGRRGVNDSPGPIYDVIEHISVGGASGWSMGARRGAQTTGALSQLGRRELALKRMHRS